LQWIVLKTMRKKTQKEIERWAKRIDAFVLLLCRKRKSEAYSVMVVYDEQEIIFVFSKTHTCKLFNVFIQFSISIIYRGLINIFKTKCKRVLWSEPKLAWAKLESIIHTLPILNIAQRVIDMFFWHFAEISSCVLRNYQGLPGHLTCRRLRATWT
jgi:hypothetical protein